MFNPAPPIGAVLLSSLGGDRSPLVSPEPFDRVLGQVDLASSYQVHPVLDPNYVVVLEFSPGTWN